MQKGFSIVEVLLAGSIFALFVTALTGSYLYGQESTALSGARARATLLASEGLEAVRNIRDASFANLVDGTYGLATTSNQWNLSGSSDSIGNFTRQIIISSVDTKRKSVTANVTWQQNQPRSGLVSLTTRLTDWIATNLGNWAIPLQAASINIAGNNNGRAIQIQGNYAYMIINGGASSNFVVFDISVPTSPVLVGALTLAGTPQNIFVAGTYAYVVSNSNTQELQIINISSPAAPVVAGTYDAPGTGVASGVYVVGNTAYIVKASGTPDEFVIVNVSNPARPTFIGSLNLGAPAYEVVVSDTYAYIASGSNTQELQVVDITTPAIPKLVGSLNLPSNTDAVTIALDGTTVFLGQGSTLYTVNVSNPLLPVILGSLAVTGTLNDIALNLGNGGAYLYIATSDSANEFKVIDVATPALPAVLGRLNLSGSNPLLGIAYDASFDRAFGASFSNVEEFLVFIPQ